MRVPRTLAIPEGMLSLHQYDYIDLCCSGGIDSTGCILMMLFAYKVPKEKLTLVHFRVDGPPENEEFFDWKETSEHLKYLSEFFDIPLVIIWDQKGLLQRIQDREMFPDALNRFCTSYVKRDVYNKFMRGRGGNFNALCISGERAEESTNRSKLPVFSEHKTTAKTKGRFVHWFRPILHLTKNEVRWFMREAGVKEHPCYSYGISRCSCKFCIFNSKEEMKRVASLYPDDFAKLKRLEREMGHTMKYADGRRIPLCEFVDEDAPFEQLKLI